jgi:hypothetical protein
MMLRSSVISRKGTSDYYGWFNPPSRNPNVEPSSIDVHRHGSYSLQLTFACNWELAYDLADCRLWIEEEQNLLGEIEGDSIEEVTERCVQSRNELERRLLRGQSASDAAGRGSR